MGNSETHTIIRLDSVSVILDGGGQSQLVLQDFNVEIRTNEVLGIIGPNGCGKTTLLRTIAGLLNTYDGSIDRSVSLKQVGFIFQDVSSNLLPWLRVIDNVALPLSIRKQGKTIARIAARAALERLSISDLADRFPMELSGGQRQLVIIARWLTDAPPPLLLLDEAFSMLDVRQRERVRTIVTELSQGGTTVLVVSHDMLDIAACTHRVLVLSPLPSSVMSIIDFQKTSSVSDRMEKLWEASAGF